MKAKIALLAFTCALMLPLMELAVRVVAPQQVSWLDIFRRHPTLPLYKFQENISAELDTGDSRWTVHTDENGFRVGSPTPAPDDRPAFLWLGDSFTFAYGVNYADSFVGRLASMPGTHLRQVDAGVGGYGPTQYRQTLEYILSKGMQPKAVGVAVFLGNDFTDLIDSKDVPVADGILGNEGGLKSFLKRNFHLYRLAAASLHRLHPYGIHPDLAMNAQVSAWSDGPLRGIDGPFREEMGKIAAICKEHGIGLAVMLIPSPGMTDAIARGAPKSPDGLSDQSLPLEHARADLDALGIRYLDLTPVLVKHPVTETYFFFDGHFTPRGNEIVASTLQQEWKPLLEGQ